MSEKHKKYYIKNLYGGMHNINMIVELFFELQLSMKMYHWNTNSFSRHKGTDNFGSEFNSLFDKLVEVMIGITGNKPSLDKVSVNMLNDDSAKGYLENKRDELNNMRNDIKDNSLLNIYDEILALINQTIYLFNLK